MTGIIRFNHARVAVVFFLPLLFLCMLQGFSTAEESSLEKGIKFFHSEKFELAESMFRRAVSEDSGNYKAYAYLGDIFLAKKNYVEAIQEYRKALEVNPSYGWASFGLGMAYEEMDVPEEAERYYRMAYQMNDEIVEAYLNLGNLYYKQKDVEKTIEAWERYLSLAPENPQYETIETAIAYLRESDFKFPEEIAAEKEARAAAERAERQQQVLDQIRSADIDLKRSADAEERKASEREHGILDDFD